MASIYLDHAATTPLDPRVLSAMLPYLQDTFGNPSSVHTVGQKARAAVDSARVTVAEILCCEPREIIFTSGGTESDNLALRGTLTQSLSQSSIAHPQSHIEKPHLITTTIEHSAVLRTAEDLAKNGIEVTYLPVDEYGRVTVAQVEAAIQPNTRLISIMLANNEIGTIQPIRDIGKMLEKRRERGMHAPLLHTDAVQGGGILPLDVRHLKCDLLSLSSHKFYGPKGVGILYAKAGTPLQAIQTGGGQEHRLRASTENVAGIVGCAAALRLAEGQREKESIRQTKLRDYLIKKLTTDIPRTTLNGHPTERLPGNVNISPQDVEGESVLLRLDLAGICASSGSACSSGTLDPSHVLLAIGLDESSARSALRLTLGTATTKREIDTTIKTLKKIVADLRALNPSI